MALLIEKQTQILGDIDVSELYVRFTLNYNMRGSRLDLTNRVFPSRASYDSLANGIVVEGIPSEKAFNYDRAIDGSDLLTAAHDKLKDFLSTDMMKDEVILDPSTGEIVYTQEPILDPSTGLQMEDPSTGELYWMNGDPSTQLVISVPKFAADSSISLIDID